MAQELKWRRACWSSEMVLDCGEVCVRLIGVRCALELSTAGTCIAAGKYGE